jgi:hypothetical protein
MFTSCSKVDNFCSLSQKKTNHKQVLMYSLKVKKYIFNDQHEDSL